MPFNIVKTHAYYLSIMTDDIAPALATPTDLSTAKMGVGKGVFSPGPFSTLADCDQATNTGLGISNAILWGAPINEVDGSVTSQSPSHLFRASAITTPESITNVYVSDGATALLGVAMVAPSIEIVNVGDGFSAIANWNSGQTPGNCNVVVIE